MGKYAVVNPATQERVRVFNDATDNEIQEALASAQGAYSGWSRKTTIGERSALITRAAELMEERKQSLAEIINREMGKPVEESVGEVEFSAGILRAFAENSDAWLADDELTVKDGMRTVVKTQGVGVILGIMPWNYPYYQVARFAGPNLILGNTVIIKHANQCPESASALEEIFKDAGFPVGAYVNVFANHDQISTIIADDRIQGVSLTGSERAGAIVAEQAGRHLKKCVLELGGSDPFIVLETADVDAAVKHAVWGRMKNMGQSCTGSKRFIVIDSIFEEFKEKFLAEIGAQNHASAELAPLSSPDATRTLTEQVERAVIQGAELSVGDTNPNGNFFTPGVLTGITKDMDIYAEELFGPVAQLYRVANAEAAIALANDNPYGLGSVVICDDVKRAEEVGDLLDVGMVYINAAGLDGTDVPFGGVKKSGYGREIGKLGAAEFSNRKIYRFAN